MKHAFVGTTGDPADLVALGVLAEQHGWDGYFSWDATSMAGAGSVDPFTVLAAVAAATHRITLGALVVAVAKRRAWEFAQQALMVDRISGGRLVLPVGTGVTVDAGLQAAGVGDDRRMLADRLDQILAFAADAWAGRPARDPDSGVEFTFPPATRSAIPVWPVGILGTRSLRRAARWDGVTVQLGADRTGDADGTGELSRLVARLRELGAGPEVEVLAQSDLLTGSEAEERSRAWEAAGASWLVQADWSPAATVDSQRAHLEAGPPT